MNKKRLSFLVDIGVGKKIEEWLVKEGFDTKSVRDLDPRMPDYQILKIASRVDTFMFFNYCPVS